jgi:hypothetical protein
MKKISIFFLLIASISCKQPLQSSSYYETNYATGQTTQRNGIALPQIKEKYAIDVYFKPEKPNFEVEAIQEVSISEEDFDAKHLQTINDRMVKRGQTADKKKILIAALIEKAENLGASCLYEVNYKYYTTKTSSGYTIIGMAGKYSLNNLKN